MATLVRQFDQKMPAILQELEDVKAAQMPGSRPHADIDRAKVTVDYSFSLRNYLDNGASGSSDSILAVTPSFQVSSFDPTNSILTSRYYTALVSQPTNTDIHTNRMMREDTTLCTQIFIRNIALFKTMVLQVDPSHSINDVKVVVRAKIGSPNAEFDLLYKRILGGDQSLQFHLGLHFFQVRQATQHLYCELSLPGPRGYR